MASPYAFGHYTGKKTGRNGRLIQQHDMTGSIFVDRGLLNRPGENNCFLNSAIQVLWHIDVFRRSFRELRNRHYCDGDSCIFCALEVIFTQYQHTSASAIPPNAVRSALASCYKNQRKFQLGLMEDAVECYEELLTQMHFHLTGNRDDEPCSTPHCISHQKFAMTLLERTECDCGATSEPLPMVQYIHYYSVAALVEELGKVSNKSVPKDPSLFAKMLHKANCIDTQRECPNYINCHHLVRPHQILLNSLDVVCVGLIWDSNQPRPKLIQLLADSISLSLKLSDLFDQTLTSEASVQEYSLSAVVTYYGKHYSSFCYHSNHREWVYLDDANVRKVGHKWDDVKELFNKGHYQPLLLLYTLPDAKPVDISGAPSAKVTVEDAPPDSDNTASQSMQQTKAPPTSEGNGSQLQPVVLLDKVSTIAPPPPSSSPRASPTPDKATDLISFDSINVRAPSVTSASPSLLSRQAWGTPATQPGSVVTPAPLSLSNSQVGGTPATQPGSVVTPAPLSLSNRQVGGTPTTRPGTTDTMNDLIVLDSVRTSDITMAMRQHQQQQGPGLFESDMVIVGESTTTLKQANGAVGASSASGRPYPSGLSDTNSRHQSRVVTGVTNSPLLGGNKWSDFNVSSPQQPLSQKSSSQQPLSQDATGVLYREGFGLTRVDFMCVETVQAWTKGEMGLAKGDLEVGLLAFSKAADLLQAALQEPVIQSNPSRRAALTAKRTEALNRTGQLHRSIAEKAASGRLCLMCHRNIGREPDYKLCGPCEMRKRLNN